MGLPDLLNDNEDNDWAQQLREGESESADSEGSIIDAIIQAATQENSGEIGVMPISQKEDSLVSKKPKGKRVVYSVACTLHLSGSDYQIQYLASSPEYDKGYRLNKINANKPTGYNVIQKDGVIICECADFNFRNQNCKHVKGLVDMGFFSTPSISERMSSGVFDG